MAIFLLAFAVLLSTSVFSPKSKLFNGVIVLNMYKNGQSLPQKTLFLRRVLELSPVQVYWFLYSEAQRVKMLVYFLARLLIQDLSLASQTLQGQDAEQFKVSIPKIPAYFTVQKFHDKTYSWLCDVVLPLDAFLIQYIYMPVGYWGSYDCAFAWMEQCKCTIIIHVYPNQVL